MRRKPYILAKKTQLRTTLRTKSGMLSIKANCLGSTSQNNKNRTSEQSEVVAYIVLYAD